MKNIKCLDPVPLGNNFSPFKVLILLLGLLGSMHTNAGMEYSIPPGFSKAFSPDTIGPGSVSMLTFTINNLESMEGVEDLAFTDVLPAGVTIAEPAAASTNCSLQAGSSLSAPAGGTTISLTDHGVGAGSQCWVRVNVTATTPGTHTNISGDLTSSAGNSGTASADLDVDVSLPGFSKSFAPSTVALGGRSTLTLTIDNSANASAVPNLDFVDNLPSGMVIASPTNASTTCGTATIPPSLTANAGASQIVLDADGIASFPAVAAFATCTVTVDVSTTGSGILSNITGQLLVNFVASGKASAILNVTSSPLSIRKEFVDDPVPPGGIVELKFTITNFDRDFSATGLAFSDDLTAVLADLTFSSLLFNDCGGTVSGVGTTTIALSAATLAPGASCTVTAELTVDADSVPGAYPNTTSDVTATIDGQPVTGNSAGDILFVEPIPLLTKEFLQVGTLLPDPVVEPGDDVVIRFTINNTSTTSAATDIEFIDELTDGSGGSPPDPTTGFLPFPVSVALPPVPDPPCGAGSSLALVFINTDREGLALTGGELSAAPGAMASCTFDVTVTIPADFPAGTYLNTTEQITATVAGATRLGQAASDTLTVIAAPNLSKAFSDDPVPPGGSVTLEFTLTQPADAGGDATAITFTDDLAALVPTVPGLVATGLPITEACDPDGPGGAPGTGTLSGSAGDTLLTFMDGELAPGEECTFSVTLAVPPGAPVGAHANTTSEVSATVGGLPVTSAPASDDLDIAKLVFSKEFLGGPVIAGDTVTLRFTVDNLGTAGVDDAAIVFFIDDLAAVLPGPAPDLVATLPPTADTCGGTMSGTSSLVYIGGSVAGGASCSIEVEITVPASTDDGDYINTSTGLFATIGGDTVVTEPATDALMVNSNLINLDKTFTDDPVLPGETATLELVLTNLDPLRAASSITFTDDLGAVLPGLIFSGGSNDCGAMLSPGGLVSVAGVALMAGASCSFTLDVVVPAAAEPGTYLNTTSAIAATMDGLAITGDPASDELTVQALSFSKSFDGLSVATGTPVLTFTITNMSSTDAAVGLAFSDDLDTVIAGLVATNLPLADVCGAGSMLSGTSFLTLTAGNLPADSSCSIDVELLVPASATTGVYPNTSSELFSAGLLVADAATADLGIEPAPMFFKQFSPDPIDTSGQISTLTFTIDNTASALPASALDFTDTLPTAITIAAPSNASTTCTGGTVTAVAGSDTISYTGGTVGAASSCTLMVDTTAVTLGTHLNTSGDLTSSSGNSGTASDALTVFFADMDMDTIADHLDNCPADPNTDQANNDMDMLGDVCDPDDDNDTIPDLTDNCPIDANTDQANNDMDMLGDVCDPDDDNDTIADVVDNCPVDANTDQADLDMDMLGDVCDPDDDDDTIPDVIDNCPVDANTDQANADNDSLGDVCDPDADNDMFLNAVDNCPLDANPDQADLDMDGMGNACDLDSDGDLMPDDYEIANGLNPLNSFDQQADPDGDGFTNLQEFEFGTDPQMFDEDLNGNNIPDSVENNNSFIVPTIILPLLLDQ